MNLVVPVRITKSKGCRGQINGVRVITLYLSRERMRKRSLLAPPPRSLYTVFKFTFNCKKIVKDKNVGSPWIFISLGYLK